MELSLFLSLSLSWWQRSQSGLFHCLLKGFSTGEPLSRGFVNRVATVPHLPPANQYGINITESRGAAPGHSKCYEINVLMGNVEKRAAPWCVSPKCLFGYKNLGAWGLRCVIHNGPYCSLNPFIGENRTGHFFKSLHEKCSRKCRKSLLKEETKLQKREDVLPSTTSSAPK